MSLSVEPLALTRALWRAQPYTHNEKWWCDKPADDICSALHLSPSSSPRLVRLYLPCFEEGADPERRSNLELLSRRTSTYPNVRSPCTAPSLSTTTAFAWCFQSCSVSGAHSLHLLWSRREKVSVIWEGTLAQSSLSYCSSRTTFPQHLRPHFSVIIITSMTCQAFHVCQACSILVEHLLGDNSGNC